MQRVDRPPGAPPCLLTNGRMRRDSRGVAQAMELENSYMQPVQLKWAPSTYGRRAMLYTEGIAPFM